MQKAINWSFVSLRCANYVNVGRSHLVAARGRDTVSSSEGIVRVQGQLFQRGADQIRGWFEKKFTRSP